MLLDGLAIGVMVYKTDLSGSSGACFNCCDVIVLVVGIIGWLLILLADFNWERSPDPMPWDDYEVIGAFMVMGVWYGSLDRTCCALQMSYPEVPCLS